ncbi:MAG: extracellular solute-binding protein [Deltaproteobacteria bacterium]|nr:extracellular solute-binding protein [Deltaproteobacteria bacterium]MBW2122376.1 extracellular solute-binding protein [Deltaproteobacteria bacterium]
MKRTRRYSKGKQKMTRREFLKTTAAIGASVSVGPFILGTKGQKLAKTLRVDNWGGAYQDACRIGYRLFEEKYGVKIIEGSFATTDEMLAKIKASPPGEYDAVYLDDTGVYKGIKQGLIEPLDENNLTNYKYQMKKFQHPPYDPGPEIYSMANEYYSTALVYNTDAIAGTPESWEILWDKKYSKRISLWDWAWCRIANTALYLGQNPNDISDIDAVFKAMSELNRSVLKYYKSGMEMQQLLTNRDVVLGEFWSGRTLALKDQGVPVWFKIPKEGAFINVGTVCAARGTKKKLTTELFINFITGPESYPKIAEKIHYVPCLDPKYYKVSEPIRSNPEFNPEAVEKCVITDNAYKDKHEKEWTERFNLMKAAG